MMSHFYLNLYFYWKNFYINILLKSVFPNAVLEMDPYLQLFPFALLEFGIGFSDRTFKERTRGFPCLNSMECWRSNSHQCKDSDCFGVTISDVFIVKFDSVNIYYFKISNSCSNACHCCKVCGWYIYTITSVALLLGKYFLYCVPSVIMFHWWNIFSKVNF